MVCYIIILGGDIPVDVPPTKILGGCVPGIPGGVDASDRAGQLATADTCSYVWSCVGWILQCFDAVGWAAGRAAGRASGL